MNIYLIRHGETIYNKEGRFQGQSNIPLNEAGREQAQKVARRFEDQFIQSGQIFAAIYSSPFDRTMDTAKAIGEKLHLTPKEASFLRYYFCYFIGYHNIKNPFLLLFF